MSVQDSAHVGPGLGPYQCQSRCPPHISVSILAPLRLPAPRAVPIGPGLRAHVRRASATAVVNPAIQVADSDTGDPHPLRVRGREDSEAGVP